MPQAVRSALAVAAGFLSMMIVVVVLTVVCVKAMHLQSGHPTPVYLSLNVMYSLLAAVLGGWVTARVARLRPVMHGVVLAVVMVALNAISFKGTVGQPRWYVAFLCVGPPLAAVLGAASWRGVRSQA